MRPYTDAFNLNERVRGFYARFADEKNVTIVDAVCENPGTQGIIDAVDRIISEYPDIRGICAVNSATHIIAERIAQFTAEKNMSRKPAVIGFDLVEENRRGLINNTIACIISQNPEEQGRQVFSQLYRYLVLEENPQSRIDMPFDIYFKENVL
jgi:LacI family transcriptional regulator